MEILAKGELFVHLWEGRRRVREYNEEKFMEENGGLWEN